MQALYKWTLIIYKLGIQETNFSKSELFSYMKIK